MLAAIFQGNKNLILKDFLLPKLKQYEVLVKVECCGICGTDKHIFDGTAPSSIPVILGHEYCGIVAEIGIPDSDFIIGQKVAIDPNIYCGHCDYCRRGMINFCRNLKALGVTLNGGFAEYSVVPASQVYILPDNIDLSIAAFSEPLSCCLRGIEHANIRLGNNVVIIGGGSIGLIMIQLAKIIGAAKIILVEPDISKRNLGVELGADYSLNPKDEKIFEEIKELTNNQVDVVIECVGSSEAVNNAIKIVDKGGKVIIFGLAPKSENININLQYIFQKELKIFNSYLNPFTFKTAVDLLTSNKINVQKLLSKQIYLKELPGFFSENNNSGKIKVQLINN
ncbi:MAG: zinc-dependent alcohol dehydrogenase family protein [Ignavibacteriaceae bacterium]